MEKNKSLKYELSDSSDSSKLKESGIVYKITFSDGCFYYGYTTECLEVKLRNDFAPSKNSSLCYNHLLRDNHIKIDILYRFRSATVLILVVFLYIAKYIRQMMLERGIPNVPKYPIDDSYFKMDCVKNSKILNRKFYSIVNKEDRAIKSKFFTGYYDKKFEFVMKELREIGLL